jgi:glucose/arabinose dehydrogenase
MKASGLPFGIAGLLCWSMRGRQLSSWVFRDRRSQTNAALWRPVGVVMARNDALLVADDVGNRMWQVTAEYEPA